MNNNVLCEMLNKSFLSEGIAVVEKDVQWSYYDFKQYTFFARDWLMQNNVKRIMIFLPQSFRAYCLIWGAYLAGTTFCNVNYDNPVDRLAYCHSVFKPDVIFVDRTFIDISKFGNAFLVDDFFQISSNVSVNSTLEPRHLTPAPAYVLFTSGTTGLPKGVQISRNALENFLLYTIGSWNISSKDTCSQYNSLGFDLSIADVFVAILCGATLVPIATKSEKLLPGKMIEKYRITFWHSVPSVIDLLAKANSINSICLKSLRAMSFCGEKLYPNQLEQLFSANSSLTIFNTYGPTEATIFCSLIQLDINNYTFYTDNTVSIGNAITGVNLYLEGCDETGIGELIIAGSNISDGYLQENNNSLQSFGTREIDGKITRFYPTGDYAYYKDSKLFFYGRKDSQIKLMGNRIDLSEIDYWLRKLSGVASLTIFRENRIVSFVEECGVSEVELIERVRTKLPDYYVPQCILFLKTLPHNSNDKIDQGLLLEALYESNI